MTPVVAVFGLSPADLVGEGVGAGMILAVLVVLWLRGDVTTGKACRERVTVATDACDKRVETMTEAHAVAIQALTRETEAAERDRKRWERVALDSLSYAETIVQTGAGDRDREGGEG